MQHRLAKAENLSQQALLAAGHSSKKSHLAHAWYNFACAAATAGHRDQAFEYLQKAADLGAGDIDNMANDNDLKSLRTDLRFTALIDRAKARLAASANN